ncbi:MAG: thiamine pyrophosphate-binding protein [Deltaproteobacteria bacterium]|nr:thiamine pyrophosphate-binding protein [Deltaproteobacteria bacterium]
MSKIGIEFDEEAQKQLTVPLGQRELYPTVGKYVAEVLKEQGITFAFGVPGGHIWHFIDAISRIGIKTVTFCHEQNGVYAAEGYSQVSRKTSIAYGTVGPGTGNAFSAMQQAGLSNSPIIFLAGGHEVEHDGLYNTIQESYSYRFFEHVCKWSTRVFYPWQVKQFITRGFKIASSAPKGPVSFDLGCDLLFSKDNEMRTNYWGGFFPQNMDYKPEWRFEDTAAPLRSQADPHEVAKAAKAIMSAKKPFSLIGDMAHWDDAGAELEELYTLAKIPFTTRRLGRATVTEKHPNFHRGFPRFRQEIDLIISAGVKVGFFDGFGGTWPDTVQLTNSQDQVWTYLKSPAVLVGDVKLSVRQIIDYIKANNMQVGPERAEWLARLQKSHGEATTSRKDKAYKYGPDHPRYKSNKFLHYGYMSQIIREVNEELYGSAPRVMIDGYTMSDFVMPYLQFTRSGSCLTANDQAGVGHGTAQAIGAAIADMENGSRIPNLALMGDSGFMNSGLDASVAGQYKLPIVYLVTNNGGWMPGMKYVWYGPNWDVLGPQDQYGATFHGAKMEGQERAREGTNFVKMAEAIGLQGMLCNSTASFREDLKRAYAMAEKGGAVVMDCIMDQHLCNSAIMSPAYALMYCHIPYAELPARGKATRKGCLTQWFKGLADEPAMPRADAWEPLTDAEFGYAPKEDLFK